MFAWSGTNATQAAEYVNGAYQGCMGGMQSSLYAYPQAASPGLYGAMSSQGGVERPTPYTPAVSSSAPPGSSTAVMSPATHANLFVGNLSPATTEPELTAMFQLYGTVVSTKLHVDPQTGASRRSGFVRFSTPQEAQQAIDLLNGWNGMAVKPAKSNVGQIDVPAGGKGGGGSGSNLYVTGMPAEGTTQETLSSTFREAGFAVIRSRIIPDSKGTGFAAGMVQLLDADQAARAIEKLNGTGNMSVTYAMDQSYTEGPKSGSIVMIVKYAGDGVTPCDNLYISGLPVPEVDKRSMKAIFEGLGLHVTRMKTLPASFPKSSSVAMVQLASAQEATYAIQTFHGRPAADFGIEATNAEVKPEVEASHSNLWVGQLSPNITQPILEQMFSQYGRSVSCKLALDHTGASKGFGFVKMDTIEEAQRAKQMMDGHGGMMVKFADKDVEGSAKSVPAAMPGSSLPLKFTYSGRGQAPSDKVYISGLPAPEVDQQALLQMFSFLGFPVADVNIIANSWGVGGSAAIVRLSSQELAATVIATCNGKSPAELGVNLWARETAQPHVVSPRFTRPSEGAGCWNRASSW